MDSIGVGPIGADCMGKCHTSAFGTVKAAFPGVRCPRPEVLLDTPLPKARESAEQSGFAR